MRHNDTVADLAALTVPVRITRENVDELLDNHRIEIHMRNGNWWSVRRNGVTKYWKRDKARVYIPVKFGLKMCAQITEHDFRGPEQALSLDEFRVKPEVR